MKKVFEPMVKVYLRKNGEIYILASSLLKGIGGVESEPFFAHTIAEGKEVLGNSVQQAKAGSLSYLERENYLDYIPPYFEWAGVSSYGQFAKHTKSVSITFAEGNIVFCPTKNKRGTWYGIKDKIVLLETGAEAVQIGEQLLRSFEDAIA